LQLTGNYWNSVNLVKLLELHTASKCQHHLSLKELTLSGSGRHGETVTPLLHYIKQGDLAAIKILIEDWGVYINAAHVGDFSVEPLMADSYLTFTSVTPLFVASLYKNYDIVRFIVGKGASISAGATVSLDNDEFSAPLTPLHAAFFMLRQINIETVRNMELVRLEIIRFLVDSGADPSVLSANIPFLSMMIKLAHSFTSKERIDYSVNMGYNLNAVYLLIELGMSVTQKCPESGKTVLHYLAGYWFIKNMEAFVDLILDKGGDLEAEDHLGITPIMSTVIGGGILNREFLDYLLERREIANKNKIDALEVAAASYLRNGMPTDDSRLSIVIKYLTRARNLRTQRNFPLAPSQTPREGRIHEWITSSDLQDIQQRHHELRMQSMLIRLRIFSSLHWKVVDRYLWPMITTYVNYAGLDSHSMPWLLDFLWTFLETIKRLNLHEGGIWSVPFETVKKLTELLTRRRHTTLCNIKSLTTSMNLVSKICSNHLDGAERVEDYLIALVQLVSLLAELVPTDSPIIESVRHIVSKERDPDGQPLYCGRDLIPVACSYFVGLDNLPARNLFAVINLLLKHEADPHAVDEFGWGALHHLAIAEACGRNVGAVARLFLDLGVHFDRVDKDRRTPADIYRQRKTYNRRFVNELPLHRLNTMTPVLEGDPFIRLPDWLQEDVPMLKCLAARVIRRHKINYSDPPYSLPNTVCGFLEWH